MQKKENFTQKTVVVRGLESRISPFKTLSIFEGARWSDGVAAHWGSVGMALYVTAGGVANGRRVEVMELRGHGRKAGAEILKVPFRLVNMTGSGGKEKLNWFGNSGFAQCHWVAEVKCWVLEQSIMQVREAIHGVATIHGAANIIHLNA